MGWRQDARVSPESGGAAEAPPSLPLAKGDSGFLGPRPPTPGTGHHHLSGRVSSFVKRSSGRLNSVELRWRTEGREEQSSGPGLREEKDAVLPGRGPHRRAKQGKGAAARGDQGSAGARRSAPNTWPHATHHALWVHQQQVLGLPALQAGEHVLARAARALPHQEVPVQLQQRLGLPPAQLPVEPGLPSELLSHGHRLGGRRHPKGIFEGLWGFRERRLRGATGPTQAGTHTFTEGRAEEQEPRGKREAQKRRQEHSLMSKRSRGVLPLTAALGGPAAPPACRALSRFCTLT